MNEIAVIVSRCLSFLHKVHARSAWRPLARTVGSGNGTPGAGGRWLCLALRDYYFLGWLGFRFWRSLRDYYFSEPKITAINYPPPIAIVRRPLG